MDLDPYNWEIILTWNEKINKYKDPVYTFKVRDKEINANAYGITFSFKSRK
jgi:methylmalonyl-CoA mutase